MKDKFTTLGGKKMGKKDENAIVKYNNKLNYIPLKGMSQIENDVFFALLYKLKNQGTEEVRLNFSDLKRLINFNQSNEHIRKSIKGITKKIARSIVEFETKDEIQFFALFQILAIPQDEDFYIRAKISENFSFLINNINSHFTLFELAEFSGLSSKYSQSLYRLLKQFRKTGIFIINWSEFRDILDIPKSYKICDIDRQILKPATKEFEEKNIFRELRYNKIRGFGRGRPVEKIEFRFTPEVEKIIEIKTDKEDLIFKLGCEGVNKKTAEEYADKAERTDKIKVILEKFDKIVKRAEKHTSKQKYLLGAIRNEIAGIEQRNITKVLPPKIKREEKEEEFVYGEIPESARKILEGFKREGLLKDEE